MTFTLRAAALEDAEALASIDASTSGQPWSEAAFITELGHAARRYIVAQLGRSTEVVGYAGIALMDGDAHVMGIGVLPSQQRRGCGRALLLAICAEAERAGADAMTLEVRPSNDVARHLYRLAGFSEAGRRTSYYSNGEDALIMWRRARAPAQQLAAVKRPGAQDLDTDGPVPFGKDGG